MANCYCVLLVSILAFLIILPPTTTFSPQIEHSTAQTLTGVTSNNHIARANQSPSFLKDAFFPREPRLEDVNPISGFAPTGIASYGSNGIIQTSSVRGITSLNEISLGYFSAEIINNSQATPYVGVKNGSLQENAVLWLGNLGTYWTQNVVLITENNPSSYTLQLINNIWNFTSVTSNMNQNAIHGAGSIQCETLNGIVSCAYITVGSGSIRVTAPFTVTLTMSIANAGSGAASVLFQYQIHDATGNNFSAQYDDATLFPSSPRTVSDFQIGGETPVSESPGGGTTITLPSDLELVFGGPGGGSSVFVNSISGSQQLMYLNGSSYVSVPDSFSIGSDTGEEASGISVAGDFANPTLPSTILSSGEVSAQQLWPLPLSFLIQGQNEFGTNTLDLQGEVVYSLGVAPNITVRPAADLIVKDNLTGASITTNTNGAFSFPFKATQKGTYQDSINFPGSIEFKNSSDILQIAVSSINIMGAGSGVITAFVNGTQFSIQNQTHILVPVIQGTTLVVTFQNSSNSGSLQEHFEGFNTGQARVILTGNSPEAFTASFATTGIGTAPGVFFIYAIVGSLALVVGIVTGFLLARRTKSDILPPAA
jgi:hypothetical protein